jgi:hypothetical protein
MRIGVASDPNAVDHTKPFDAIGSRFTKAYTNTYPALPMAMSSRKTNDQFPKIGAASFPETSLFAEPRGDLLYYPTIRFP